MRSVFNQTRQVVSRTSRKGDGMALVIIVSGFVRQDSP